MTIREQLNRTLRKWILVLLFSILIIIFCVLNLNHRNNYVLSDYAIANLRNNKVPEQILLKLNTIKDQEFTSHEFTNHLYELLSFDELALYQAKIMNHSLITGDSNNPYRDLFVGLIAATIFAIAIGCYLSSHALACPNCSQNLGRLITSKSVVSVHKELQFCPFCGIDFDKEVTLGAGRTKPSYRVGCHDAVRERSLTVAARLKNAPSRSRLG